MCLRVKFRFRNRKMGSAETRSEKENVCGLSAVVNVYLFFLLLHWKIKIKMESETNNSSRGFCYLSSQFVAALSALIVVVLFIFILGEK